MDEQRIFTIEFRDDLKFLADSLGFTEDQSEALCDDFILGNYAVADYLTAASETQERYEGWWA